MESFFDSTLFHWVILPLLIFLARILDVSIGTVRIIFVSRGLKLMAAFLGFVEVLIWISVIGQVLQNLTNPVTYIAYAAGFATGNYIGILIEQRISIGKIIIRIITADNTDDLRKHLKSHSIRYTVIDAAGSTGSVQLLFTIMDRSKLPLMLEKINKYNPTAFYSIEDVRQVREGEFPGSFRPLTARRPFSRIRQFSIMKKK